MTIAKPKAVRTVGRKPAASKGAKTADFELTPAVETAKPKAKPKMVSAFSMYPDLHMAIAMLTKRQSQLEGKKAELVGKWVEELTRIHTEIGKWKRLEGLTEAVKRPTSE